MTKKSSPQFVLLFITVFTLVAFFLAAYFWQKKIINLYDENNSPIIQDRYDKIIATLNNRRGYWSEYLNEVPERFKNLLLKKEDRWFYYHFGLNPFSIIKASGGYLGLTPRKASSTITQQLVKILLQNEQERSLKNKIIETLHALALEIYQSKKNILKMYANSIYFGNQAQGLKEASQLYFNTNPELLTDGQILQLLSSINNPSGHNPAQKDNLLLALSLGKKFKIINDMASMNDVSTVKKNIAQRNRFNSTFFELRDFINNENLNVRYKTTVDQDLTEKVRAIAKRNIEILKQKNAKNAAIIIIKLPENEVLTLIGSINPISSSIGSQINMLQEPRPIGSTIKPFIYLKAFEKGARPYTLVDDREYKYITAVGLPLYPKNFDLKFRGLVTLRYALSNSLNVPSVKVLEYLGLQEFYRFLEKTLGFKPVQNLNNYQLGIALGALEMKLYDLAQYFTVFPNQGILRPLKIRSNDSKKSSPDKIITEPKYIQLVNKILNDRKTGIEQFGMVSDLNLFQDNYCLKTGTSKDFKDSWVIGYTPDFLVGVWMGNTENTPMDAVSGQTGAGRIWAETMELLFNSPYNKKTPLDFGLIKDFKSENGVEYGLSGDNYKKAKNLLNEQEKTLILNPHDQDIFLLEPETQINLQAKEKVRWFINNQPLSQGENYLFSPPQAGSYQIKAKDNSGQEETVTIWLEKK